MKALSVSSLLSWKTGWLRTLQPANPIPEPDGLDAFAAERAADAPPRSDAPASGRRHRWTIAILAVVALVEAPVAGLWIYEWSRQDAAANAPLPQRRDIQPAPLAAAPIVPAPIESLAPVQTPEMSPAPARAAVEEPQRAAAAAAAGGWVSVKAPMPMQVFEDGRLIGTTEVDRIMLPVGTRRLEIVSEALGYRARHEVAIRAGQTSTVRLDMPTGTLALNAQPWAEVWIDGVRVGETPIGNLTRTIGPHEIVFRHPDLGEKKTTVLVTLKEPARVGVDLRSKS